MANTQNITTVSEIQAVENSDKVFVNDNGTLKQVSVSNLMNQAPSGITEETDPTVPAWAKQPTKPSYTADEVGALPVGTKIPAKTSDLTNNSGYLTQIPEEYVTETELGQKGYITEDDIPDKLPSPGTLTFTGAVNDTYDGSTDKTINIPTGGGEGGTSDYNALTNKPKLNGVEIVGNKTSADYKIVSSEQGAENNGKFLGVGADGNVILVGKPSYTATEVGARPNTWTPSAEDVGALPNDTEIPSKTSDLENDSGFITGTDIPETLPNPQKIIFTGAVTAEYDGSTEQTINIPESTGGDSYTLPIMSSDQLGGGKAVEKTDEDVPVAVDTKTGQLFVPTYPVQGGITEEQKQQLEQNTQDITDLKSALEQIEGGGWSSTQIDLFEAFTNVIAYTSPDANSIVSSLISSLRSGSTDTPKDTYSIIYALNNVSSSNNDNSVQSGGAYTTTLTANSGYAINSVSVKMSGMDITENTYSDGEINIPYVTGNIIITATGVLQSEYIQDGLLWEFTNLNGPKIIDGGQAIFNTPNDFTVFVAAKKTESMNNYNHSWVAGERSREFDFWRNWNGSVNVKAYYEDLSSYNSLSYTPDNLDAMIYTCCKQEKGKQYLYDETTLKGTTKDMPSYTGLTGNLTINENSVMPKILIYNRALTEEEIKQNINAMKAEVGE